MPCRSVSKADQQKDGVLLRKGVLVLIKDSIKNRANWRVGCMVDSIVGKDRVPRGYKI